MSSVIYIYTYKTLKHVRGSSTNIGIKGCVTLLAVPVAGRCPVQGFDARWTASRHLAERWADVFPCKFLTFGKWPGAISQRVTDVVLRKFLWLQLMGPWMAMDGHSLPLSDPQAP